MEPWHTFVLTYGHRARRDHLAHIVNQPADAITRLRATGAVVRGPRRGFVELFTTWHGRPPADTDWPAPRRVHGSYEWQPIELAHVASLVGHIGPREMAAVLTTRLRRITGDVTATRSYNGVVCALQRSGLQTTDVLGGLTVAQAAREIGTRSILDHEIRNGKLRARRVGRYLVIAYAEFDRWKATRVYPPTGFIRLASLKRPLGIRSDKLSEWARMGYVPSAIRCNPTGTRERSTQFGTWYIDPKIAKKLIADRRAGRPMPWWRKPEPSNLAITFKLWQRRQHPADCAICQTIWGPLGAPATYDDYQHRYPPLAHGAKRHLTMVWSPGISRQQLAREARVSVTTIQRAIANGVLRATRRGRQTWINRVDATKWKAGRCPTGDSPKSWLTIATAAKMYAFTQAELRTLIGTGQLRAKVGNFGAMRGLTYVPKRQLRDLRNDLGYSEAEAAKRVGVSIARLRVLLRGLEWRPAPRIPAEVIANCKKRKYSSAGVTIREAARQVRKPIAWVHQRIADGTIRITRTEWNKHRRYVSAPMLARLREAAQSGAAPPPRLAKTWLQVSDAAVLAGVSAATIQHWSEIGEIAWRLHPTIGHRRYHRASVMTRARAWWARPRWRRPNPPAWLRDTAA